MKFSTAILVGVLGLASGAFGEIFTWTGAVDGAWTNAANWTLNGAVATRCPGVCSNEIFSASGVTNTGWEASVHLTDGVNFVSVPDGAATTIDFTGLYCVSSIVFKAGCSAYTLGSSENDVIPIHTQGGSYAKGGWFDIEAGATVPTLVGGFSLGFSYIPIQPNTGSASNPTYYCYMTIRNNASEELVFNSIGHSRIIAANGSITNPHFYLKFDGTGNFRFNGPTRGVKKYSSSLFQCMWFVFTTSGKVVFSTPQFGRGLTGTTRDPESLHGLLCMELAGTPFVEIEEGCRVSFSEWNDPLVRFTKNGTIGGAGTLQLCVQHTKGIGGNYGRVYVSQNVTGTVACNLDIYDATSTTRNPSLIALRFHESASASGTFNVIGPSNGHAGPVWFYSAPMTYRADKIANFGTGTEAYFRVDGTFEYAGAGNETFARNGLFAANGKTATIRNSGTGMLTVSSVFSPTNETFTGSSVVLSPETAPIRFTGAVRGAIPLVKTGAGSLVLASEIDWSGTSALRLQAGEVDISELVADGTAVLPVPVTFDSGVSTLVVPDGVTLKIPSLAATAGMPTGTLDIRCRTGRVQLVSSSVLPVGVTVNGTSAVLDAENRIVVPTPDYDVAIAARGDVMPDAATKVVAIATSGTSGEDTLAEPETTVKKLIHFDSTDATIAVGEGRTFAAATVEMLGLSGNLWIGSVDDGGTFAGVDGTLDIVNRNKLSTLGVQAKLAEGTTLRIAEGSEGVVELCGGSVGAVSLDMPVGTMRISGDRTFMVNGGVVGTNLAEAVTATLVVDGARDVVLGEKPFHVGGAKARPSNQQSIGRMIVTNSLVRNASVETKTYRSASTNDAVCVGLNGDAVLEIQDGTIFTNRLIVGGLYEPYSKSEQISHGTVIQTGGEMTVLGSTSVGDGSTIGTESGNGYYELRGGRLVWMGSLSVGHFTPGAGSFAQFGGESIFTNAFGSTSKSTVGPNAGANGGAAVMRFAGGRSKVRAHVNLAGGLTNVSRSMLSVENDAEVDADNNTVKLCGAHNTHNSFKYSRQADVALAGGVLRAAGFFVGYNSACPDYPQVYSVGFNGGTFQTGASGQDIAAASSTSARAMTNFVVYADGVTIDTDGKTGNRSSASFRGAWGRGVANIPVANKVYSKTFIAAPYVLVIGDGVGATAVADFDSTSGKVTGIRVLTPGAGYTTAKAIVYKDTSYQYADDSWEPVSCTLVDNVNSGSFTKTGDGDFTLGAANTWGGKTVLKGGVLRLAAEGALPPNGTVVYAGGSLETTVAAAPAAFTAEIPAEAVAAARPLTLLTYTDGAPTAIPEIAVEGIPAEQASLWSVVSSGNVVRLRCNRGTLLIFR